MSGDRDRARPAADGVSPGFAGGAPPTAAEPGAAVVGSAPAGEGGSPLPLEVGEEYVTKGDYVAMVVERDEMRGDLQRVAADFENYKRRAAREREQASAAAETRLLRELLGVIDDTERAIDHSTKAGSSPESVAEGLRTVLSRLDGVVRSHGLERIDTSGAFDPNLHEAMMVQPGPNGEADDTILTVLESGWKVGERVLRHARVIVAGGG